MDILIYTTKERLRHKKNLRNACSFWTFPHYPKKFDEHEDNVFFAYDGRVQGFFDNDFSSFYGRDVPENSVRFSPRWNPIKEGFPVKPFQGFKYLQKRVSDDLRKSEVNGN
jgi:hypothetical protein